MITKFISGGLDGQDRVSKFTISLERLLRSFDAVYKNLFIIEKMGVWIHFSLKQMVFTIQRFIYKEKFECPLRNHCLTIVPMAFGEGGQGIFQNVSLGDPLYRNPCSRLKVGPYIGRCLTRFQQIVYFLASPLDLKHKTLF